MTLFDLTLLLIHRGLSSSLYWQFSDTADESTLGFWTLKTENCPTLHMANDWNVYEPVSGKWFDKENVQIRKVFISINSLSFVGANQRTSYKHQVKNLPR